jgi:hypothetical protein
VWRVADRALRTLRCFLGAGCVFFGRSRVYGLPVAVVSQGFVFFIVFRG